MGGFIGHVIPGTLFVLFAAWWFIGEILQNVRRRATSLKRGSNTQTTKDEAQFEAVPLVWYPCYGQKISKVPVEPMLKVVLVVCGVLVELPLSHSATLLEENGDFVSNNLPNYQHAMMYCFFGLSGLVDLVKWYDILPLPPKLDFLALSFAFWMEGVLFSLHLHGRNELNALMHTILFIIIFVTAVFFSLATFFDQVFPYLSFAKVYLVGLQGTWLFQIAFVLHGPKPWKSIHSNVEFIAIAFALHALILFIIQLIGCIVLRDLWIKKRQLKERFSSYNSDEEYN